MTKRDLNITTNEEWNTLLLLCSGIQENLSGAELLCGMPARMKRKNFIKSQKFFPFAHKICYFFVDIFSSFSFEHYRSI